MAYSGTSFGLVCLICVLCFASSAHAFGAGNIGTTSKIEGSAFRHGDIEDVLLTIAMARAAGGKKFSKLDVKRVYFGNWLRDYSQAVDVGTVKYVSAEAIRILLWILGFMSFGYATKEFEVTTARLGCYRPEEHIDNPKNYADNEDARQYDRRLRAPVDERRELSVDEGTGLKNYIANERAGIDTSAGLVRNLFGRCIQLGRKYARSNNKDDLYEALRLLGTGLHCLEDFLAHSNYTELALIEMGEREVFPHVGRRTQVQLRELRQPVYPCVTGTFGGTDFLHSVMGEFNDKATQSEIQQLENTMNQAQRNEGDTSALQDLLNKVPDGMFGGQNESQKADDLKQNAQAHQMQNTRISPRESEEWVQYLNDVQKQIYPVLEWHDEVMKGITETIDNIPILPDLIEQIQEQVNTFVFSLLAPYVVPIINQVKNELNTGSNEIIQSSIAEQHIVFRDDYSSDPTHSMLAKDHFSNVLNDPAGKIASAMVKWVVPQLIECWDDDRADVDRTLSRIIDGVLHHPALRDYGRDGASEGRQIMFGVVQRWWQEKSEREKDGLRDQLSRSGVENGRNHKPGVVDHGHGCNKPLGMPNVNTAQSSSAIGGQAASAVMGGLSDALAGGSAGGQKYSSGGQSELGKIAGEAVGGGALGSIVGGLAGGLLGGAFGEDEKKSKKSEKYGRDGSHNETYSEYGRSGNTYGQAQYSRTDTPGGRQEEYTRYEQNEGRSSGYGTQQYTETARYDSSGNRTHHHEERTAYGSESQRYGSGGYSGESSYKKKKKDKSDDDDDDSDDEYKKKKKREKKEKKEKKKKYGHKKDSDDDDDDDDDDSDDDSNKKKYRNEYGSSGRERRDSDEHGRQRRDDNEYGESRTSGYGGGRESGYSGSGRQAGGYGGSTYGRESEYSTSRREDDNSSGRQTTGYGDSSYGRESGSSSTRRDDGEYGSSSRQTGGYGSTTYGQETSSGYGGSTYGRETTSGYGGGDAYGRETSGGYRGGDSYGRDRDTEQTYGGGGDTYGRESSGGGYGGSSYGRSGGGYGGDDDNQGGDGRSRGGGGYGDESEQMPGAFGAQEDEDEGRRRRYEY